jgi:hypothetical protein
VRDGRTRLRPAVGRRSLLLQPGRLWVILIPDVLARRESARVRESVGGAASIKMTEDGMGTLDAQVSPYDQSAAWFGLELYCSGGEMVNGPLACDGGALSHVRLAVRSVDGGISMLDPGRQSKRASKDAGKDAPRGGGFEAPSPHGFGASRSATRVSPGTDICTHTRKCLPFPCR